MYQYQVSFGDAIKRAFSNYCCFTGRASRSEYWWFTLFNFLISLVFTIGSTIIGVISVTNGETPSNVNIFTILSWIYSAAVLLPSWGLMFRRLHDAGHSGWNCLWGLLPCIGWIILIVYYCQESEPEENIYGPVPNTIGDDEIGY